MRCLSILFLCWLLPVCAAHADALDYDAFARLPIQHEGRIKPLNSFAMTALERFHGTTHLNGKPAIAWLAQAMFDPVSAMDAPLFLVKDAETQAMLNLAPKPDNLYSFTDITPALEASQKLLQSLMQLPAHDLSASQRGALELYENAESFNQIILSCTLLLPFSLDLKLDNIPAHPDFMDYYKHMPAMQKSLQALVTRKGADLDNYTPAEAQLAQAVNQLTMTMESSRGNTLLSVIPPGWLGNEAWLSPSAVFHSGQGSPQSARLMGLWRELALSYQAQDAAHWNEASHALQSALAHAPDVRPSALSLEILYYRLDPLGLSIGLYTAGLALTLLLLAGMSRLRLPALACTALGALLHAASIAMRMYILERPPVGTLYESLLFVSFIAVLFGLYLERRLKNGLGLLAATLSASVLLILSQTFGRGDDTMSMLIAVLNTNFWLATHVLCITSGYAFGIIAGIIAHCYLIMRCAKRDAEKTGQVLRGAYATALIALLFTSLGTILGGIWADQSWGRFWGWDPKENGALLICLWLIWLLHGRISRHFHERGFAIALGLLNVVIALSWLGVNLLSTGLHSYGFTDKAALTLAGFCTAEFTFAAVTFAILWRREHAASY